MTSWFHKKIMCLPFEVITLMSNVLYPLYSCTIHRQVGNERFFNLLNSHWEIFVLCVCNLRVLHKDSILFTHPSKSTAKDDPRKAGKTRGGQISLQKAINALSFPQHYQGRSTQSTLVHASVFVLL